MVQPKTVILTGPTAVGKSDLALQFALEQSLRSASNTNAKPIEIINADSVCFYQHFDIGSAKPSREDLKLVPHHLINVASPDESYDVSKFLKAVNLLLIDIHKRNARALIVGGSGFYLKALRLGLWAAPPASPDFRQALEEVEIQTLFERLLDVDPVHAKKIGSQDRYRIIRALEIIATSNGKTPSELEAGMLKEPDSRFELWVLDHDKIELQSRMKVRIDQMLSQGLIDEVMQLQERFPNAKTLHAVGYQQVVDHLQGLQPRGRDVRLGIPGLKDEILLAHRQLAKQQRTWFRGLRPEKTFRLPDQILDAKVALMNAYQ